MMLNFVRQFSKAMNVDRNSPDFNKELYTRLIEEEFEEWLEEAYSQGNKKAPDKELKELCDLLYVIFGYAITQDWDIVTAFNRVHNSNMTKLDSDGRPCFNDAGKVVKGPNYERPNLKDLVC